MIKFISRILGGKKLDEIERRIVYDDILGWRVKVGTSFLDENGCRVYHRVDLDSLVNAILDHCGIEIVPHNLGVQTKTESKKKKSK